MFRRDKNVQHAHVDVEICYRDKQQGQSHVQYTNRDMTQGRVAGTQ